MRATWIVVDHDGNDPAIVLVQAPEATAAGGSRLPDLGGVGDARGGVRGRNREHAGRIRRYGKGGATMATTNSRAATRTTTGELRPPLPPYDPHGAARKAPPPADGWTPPHPP